MAKRIRGGSGLGDSLYLRPLVEHYEKSGLQVQVLSDYAEIFLGTAAEVQPFGRNGVNVLAHYSWAKAHSGTTQWDDICRSAGFAKSLELGFKWKVCNPKLIEKVRIAADGRPIALVHGGRIPMGRKDGFGIEILPQREAFCDVLQVMRDFFLIRIGRAEEQVYQLPVNLALTRTSVADLLDLASICDRVVAQCSFAVPLAEVFDKPLLAIWAEKGFRASSSFVRLITPQKVLSKKTSQFVVDDWPKEKIQEAARAFRGV